MISLEKKILLVTDDIHLLRDLDFMLQKFRYSVIQAHNGEEALALFEKDKPDLVVMDVRMPGRDGLQIFEEMQQHTPATPTIIIIGYGDIKNAVQAMKKGACDCISKPINQNKLLFVVQKALEKQSLDQEYRHLKQVLNEQGSLYESMGDSAPIKKLVEHVEKVAPTSFTVLIEGESGAGKELVSRAIHDLSMSQKGPFVAVACGAIPETLIEDALFGHMKGAFTGAYMNKPGYFELAAGGTLFLDEVGNLTPLLQQKFLRAIQERTIRRLGGKKSVAIEVRIVAATNQPLSMDVESGRFRSDLYFRLNEFLIKVPALRERVEDIPYLTKKFVKQAKIELKKGCSEISREAMLFLMSYPWPGNVRELRTIIRQGVLLSEENIAMDFDSLIFEDPLAASPPPNFFITDMVFDGKEPLKEITSKTRAIIEKKVIQEAMVLADGNKSEVARRLKIDYKTLLRKIKTIKGRN